MLDSNESGVTYTDISSPFEELSDIGSPRADDHEHFELLEMLEDPYVEVALQAPPSLDYIPGPEEPEQAPPSPDYISGPEPADDEIDDEDDDMDIEADEEEEEEHPAPADSVVVASTAANQGSFAEETEPFETDESAATPPPHPAYPSPLSPWSSPPPRISFPPLPPILSPPSPVLSPAPPLSPIRSLGYRAAMIRLRDETASTSSPPLQLPSANRREDRPEVTLPPQKRLGIAHGPDTREIMRDPEREVGYGITDSWDEIVETLQGAPAADRRRQTVISELLRTDHRRSTEITELRTTLQGQVTALQAQVTALQGQQGLAGGPTQPELPEEADQETINATSVTNAQLQAMIDQGVTAALAARDALRSTNDDDSHNSGTGVRRIERATRGCTYTDFLKCQPLPFKGTEGVASLSQW
nr:hypothetical protein [Tanacetum cinerariifolium]